MREDWWGRRGVSSADKESVQTKGPVKYSGPAVRDHATVTLYINLHRCNENSAGNDQKRHFGCGGAINGGGFTDVLLWELCERLTFPERPLSDYVVWS